MKLQETTTCPAKVSEYESGRMGTNPIENYPEYKKWVAKTLKNPEKCVRIWGDNRKRFKMLFGKPSFVFHGQSRYDCWLIGMGPRYVLVLTAKGKGTCYEVVEGNVAAAKGDARKFLEFMDMVGGLGEDL